MGFRWSCTNHVRRSTDPVEYDLKIVDDVQEIVTEWAEGLKEKTDEETGDSDLSVFSFAQLATGQNANLGKDYSIRFVCYFLEPFCGLNSEASVILPTYSF